MTFRPDELRSLADRLRVLSLELARLFAALASLGLQRYSRDDLRRTELDLRRTADELARVADQLARAAYEVDDAFDYLRQTGEVPPLEERGATRPTQRSAAKEAWFAIFVEASDEELVANFLGALRSVWFAFGLDQIVDEEPPIRGSFFQRIRLRFKTARAVRQMLDSIVTAYVELPQATADKTAAEAVATLVAQAKDPALGDVVLQARDTVVIKLQPPSGGAPVLVARQLTPAQRRRLENNPAWLLEPKTLFSKLTIAGELGASATSSGEAE